MGVACLAKPFAQLARKYHPDTNPDKNARDKFQEIQEAYDVRPRPFLFIGLTLTEKAPT